MKTATTLILFLVASCSGASQNDGLIGTWQLAADQTPAGVSYDRLILAEDGSCRLESQKVTAAPYNGQQFVAMCSWWDDGGILYTKFGAAYIDGVQSTDYQGETYANPYTMSGDMLMIAAGAGDPGNVGTWARVTP